MAYLGSRVEAQYGETDLLDALLIHAKQSVPRRVVGQRDLRYNNNIHEQYEQRNNQPVATQATTANKSATFVKL